MYGRRVLWILMCALACGGASPLFDAPGIHRKDAAMKLLLDLSDSSRTKKGWMALYSNTVFLLRQEVDAGRPVEIILVDDGTAGPECEQVMSSDLFKNPLVTVTVQGPPVVALGLLSDLTPLGTLYAPADNHWNLRVDAAPLDPNSAAIISAIKGYDHHYVHPDFGGAWGIPYCVAGKDTPLEQVAISNTSESDKGYPGAPTGYPIPVEARTNMAYIEAMGSLSGDRHLIIFDRDRRGAFELSYVKWDGSKWTAGYGAVFKLDSNYRRPEGWTSTDAAGLCVLAGLVRYDEVYGTQPIRHATRISIKRINGYVWPASHRGSSDAGAPPLGMRLRLKQSVDLSSYPAPMRKLFQSWKEYGLIVADRGGNMYVQGTLDNRWSNAVLNPAFHALDADDFEIVKLGWKP